MKKLIYTLLVLLNFPIFICAQGFKPMSTLVAARKATGVPFTPQDLFHAKPNNADNAQKNLLQMQQDTRDNIVQTRPEALQLTLPFKNSELVLELVKSQVITPDFQVLDALTNQVYPVEDGVYYRGVVQGDPTSLAAIAVFGDQVIGVLSTAAQGNMTLGRLPYQSDNNAYVLYATQDLGSSPGFTCGISGDLPKEITTTIAQTESNVPGCVRMSLEVDYDLFVFNGNSVQSTVNYINGLMNVVIALYQAESVSIMISQIYVWTTPDSYSTGFPALTEFRSFRTSFDGDIAHLITSDPNTGGQGGYADFGVLCTSGSDRHAVSDIDETYALLPTFSYSVNVISHEMGHNFGSRHTHYCDWPGGPIDDCAAPEGSCSPGPSGQPHTVMSYCPSPPINNGFGTLPGNLIRTNVAAASCLAANCTAPACDPPSNFSLVGSPLPTSAQFSWTAGSSNTSFNLQYRIRDIGAAWSTISNITSPYTLTGLTYDTKYEAQIQGMCSSIGSPYYLGIIFRSGCNRPSQLNQSTIGPTSSLLSWLENANATSWEIKYGTPGFDPYTSGTAVVVGTNPYLLTGLQVNTTYDWYVRSVCAVSNTGFTAYGGPSTFTTLSGDVCTWNGTTGNWSDASKWSCGHVPTAVDNVIVPSGTLTLDVSNAVINALTQNGGTIAANLPLTINNQYVHTAGTISGSGEFTVNGAYTIPSGASVTVLKSLVFNGGGSIGGSIYVNGSSHLTIASNETIVWNATAANGIYKQTGGSTVGTFTIQSGGVLKKTGAFSTNLQAINMNCAGEIRNEATGNGSLFLCAESVLTNTYNGATLVLNDQTRTFMEGSIHNLANCSITGLGTLESDFFTVLNFYSTTTISADTRLYPWLGSFWNFNNVNFSVKSMRVGSASTITGSGNLTTSEYFNMDGNNATYSVNGDLMVNGNFAASNGNFFTLGGTGTATINGTTEISAGTLNINRQVIVKNNILCPSSGVLNILSGGTLSTEGVLNFNATSSTNNGVIQNAGIFKINTINPNNSFTLTPSIGFTNTGTLNIQNGILKMEKPSQIIGGILKGNGVLDISTIQNTYNLTGTIAPGASPGTFQFSGNLNLTGDETLQFEIQTPSNSDRLNVTGNATLAGTLTVSDFIPTTPAGTYIILSCTGILSGTFSNAANGAVVGSGYTITYDYGNKQVKLVKVALPLELTSLTAKPLPKSNQIQWTTASERNISHHSLERSADGISNWQEINQQVGALQSNQEIRYQYEDTEPLLISYYRLRSADLDGTEQLSPIVNVARTNKQLAMLSVFPIPVQDDLTFVFFAPEEGSGSIAVMDMLGRIALEKTIEFSNGENRKNLSMKGLPNGSYQLILRNSTGESEMIRIIKQ
jgi:Metallo-peptidase family M12/Fibronectin type III domain